MLEHLRRLLTTGFAYTAASVLSKVVAVALLPLYTAYLSPSDYGQAELLFSSVVAASIVVRFGLIEALLRFYYLQDVRGNEVIRTGFAALFWLATVGAAIAMPLAAPIADLIGLESDGAAELVQIAVMGLWVLTLYEYLVTIFRLDERAKEYFAFTFGNVVLAIPLTVVLVVPLDGGAGGLLLGSYLAGVPFLLWRIFDERDRLSLRPDVPLLRRMLRFGVPTMPAELSIYALAFIDRIIIARQIGTAELGLYALAFKFSQAIQVIVRGFQLAWPPLAYSIRDDEEARRTYAVVLTAFTALCGVIVVGMWLEARWIVRLLADAEFFDSYVVIGPLALAAALYGVYLAQVVVLGRTGRTEFNFPVTIAGTIVNVVLNVVLVSLWGIEGAAVALIASYLVIVVLMWIVTERLFPIPWQWGRLAVITVAGAIAIAGGELLLPTEGAAGLLSRALVVALYPIALWFGGAVSREERRRVVEIVRSGSLREHWERIRSEQSSETDEQARARTTLETETRDQDHL